MHTHPPPPLADRRETVETPEHVAIDYELADLGSRFAALAVDALLIALGLGVLGVGGPLLLLRLGVRGTLAGASAAVILLLIFVLVWGYFVLFEGLRAGQTPGKRVLRIRVVHDGGYPLSLRGAAVRNLMRVLDVQPFPSWLVGGVAMLLHPSTKRLGDVAAGTLVVRERTEAVLPEVAAAAGPARGAPRLGAEELAVLARYVARRDALQPEVRRRIAGSLAARLAARAGADPPPFPAAPATSAEADPDAWLVALHADEAARRAAAGGATAVGSAQAVALARRQQAVWAEYRSLLERAQRRGLASLSEPDVARFGALYREVAADLARARSYGASAALIGALERWVGAGHNLLYRPSGRSWRLLRSWLAGGFPALVRARRAPIAVAAAMLYLPALIAFGAVRRDPAREVELLPPQMVARAEEAPRREAAGRGYIEVPEVFMPVLASGIIANNVQVTFAAFAGGILAGLGTLAILVLNGVHLGAVAAAFANHGASLNLWTFVLPHGIIELTAICIAGGAGLWLGSAWLLPGRRTRRDALVVRSREAVSLLAGAVLLLVIAGAIEAFISPAPIPRALKLSLAGAFTLVLGAYLVQAGRDAESRRRAEAAGRLTALGQSSP